MVRPLRIQWAPGQKVAGVLAWPAEPRPVGVLLAHGAGAGQAHPFMSHVRAGLAASGYPTLTFNYPYAEAGRRRPDPAQRLLACHAAAAERLLAYCDRIALAGKSMGGRMASHLAAGEGPGGGHAAAAACIGLVFYGYPLVAPGKREPRDVSHLARIEAPMLFLAGTRDTLSPPAVLEDATAPLPRAVVSLVPGGDHSFRVPARDGRSHAEVLDGLVAATVSFLEDVAA